MKITKIKENSLGYGLIAAELMAEYTKPKTVPCTKEDVRVVLDRYR